MKKQMQWFGVLVLAALLAIPVSGFVPVDGPGGGTEEIRWKSDRRLNWDDFQGRPEPGNRMDALTQSGISFTWSCDGRGFTAEIYAMFMPKRSWVKRNRKSKDLLVHEQAHFDITEIHARKLRKHFAEQGNPCGMGSTAINRAAEKIMNASTKMQKQYDRETEHSENAQEQARWLRFVEEEMERLEEWAE